MELPEAAGGEQLGDRLHLVLRERDLHARKVHVVVGEGHERETARHAGARESVERVLQERPGELPRAVRSEVEEHHRVPVLDAPAVADDVRLQELVTAVR